MGRIRDAWQVLRGYAAAQDSRASTWAVSGGSATAEVGAAAPTVARRARDAVRNDPYAARIVDLWTGNAVGAAAPTSAVALPPETAQVEARLSCAAAYPRSTCQASRMRPITWFPRARSWPR